MDLKRTGKLNPQFLQLRGAGQLDLVREGSRRQRPQGPVIVDGVSEGGEEGFLEVRPAQKDRVAVRVRPAQTLAWKEDARQLVAEQHQPLFGAHVDAGV